MTIDPIAAEQAMRPFLEERLTLIGLDYDTYGPYIMTLLVNDESQFDENEESDQGEWQGVFDLLQASSETHSDNEEVWKELRIDLAKAWKIFLIQSSQEAAETRQRQEKELKEQLERDRLLAVKETEALERRQQETAHNKANDAVKRAFVDRYAYAEDDDDDDGSGDAGGGGSGGGGVDGKKEGEAFISNREIAAQAARDRAQELRSQKVQTKKEEQQKTAKARHEKDQLKDERRKRATKGERRR